MLNLVGGELYDANGLRPTTVRRQSSFPVNVPAFASFWESCAIRDFLVKLGGFVKCVCVLWFAIRSRSLDAFGRIVWWKNRSVFSMGEYGFRR